jgi:chloramphenicol 3-O phosphotransferase
LLLVGPSSVGKTTVAQALRRDLPGMWLIAGVDLFWGMLEEPRLPVGDFRSDSEMMRRITRGWHRAVAALAREGNDVIVDELGTHRWWLEDWHEVLSGLCWWSVMLTASPSALAVREEERGDRPQGLAASDLHDLADSAGFDLVIDTSTITIAECASSIAAIVTRTPSRPPEF